ncbi:MAG: hypothetical protein HS113_12445 [Verrucomicrobiales bacterium]|nr:hypothetical protein [Verrucomicrobiales bacterium]
MKSAVLSWGLVLPLTISAWSQVPRTGIECGCDRHGPYVRPGLAAVAWNALRSPQGTYRVEPFAGGNGLVVRQDNTKVLSFGPTSAAIGWGFGSDEQGFVIHMTRPGEFGIPSQHFVWLYQLGEPSRTPWQIQTPVAEALSVFSPMGRYLLHVTRDPNDRLHLWAVEVSTLTESWRHDYEAVPRPGEPGSRFGLATWGFSPDPSDASLVYLFNVETGVSLNLVSLVRRRHVINGWTFQGSAEVQFSPCGDLLSLVRYPAQAAEVWLERTLDGTHLVAGASVANFGFLEANSDFHLARTGAGSVRLTANTAGRACAEVPSEAPSWATGARLTATAIRSTSLRLVRPTAQSQGGKIVVYEFRQEVPEELVLGTLTPKEPEFTVQGLTPETEYRFAVRARNEAELWTPEPLTLTVKTAKANAVPTWPLDAALTADHVEETSLRLEWPAAVDDVAVTAYRVFQDGAVMATLDAQKRGHHVSNLVVGRSYEFRVQAGDAQDQWSTDGPRLRLATRDVSPPTWPASSRLYVVERGTHRLVLEWTPAEDNVGVYLYSISLLERGEARLFAMVDGAVTNLVLSCLLPGQHFEFAVEAGDAAGNWSTGGPRERAATAHGPNDCQSALELASVNSRAEPTQGALALGWTDDGQYRGVARSWRPALSADGRFVVFDSVAINLVPNDRNSITTILYEDGALQQFWYSDIFLRDRWAGTTERVSTRAAGGETAPPGSSGDADISGDGQRVVFASSAADLVLPDNNGKRDIFLRDRRYQTLGRLTALGLGKEANGHSDRPRISSDGSVVVFESLADNLVPADTNGAADLFAVTWPDGEYQRVSVASDGTQANAPSWGAAVSADGRFVTFASDASNLVPDDRNGAADVFVHDRVTKETSRVSVASTGAEGNGHSAKRGGDSPQASRPALSADGRFVAFDSEASNLVVGDANGCRDVFVHDRETRQTVRVSLTTTGEEGFPMPSWINPLWANSWGPDLSGDGRFVVFLSRAFLVPEKAGIAVDVFLHDRATGQTRRISACTCGGEVEPNVTGAGRAVISRDGSSIAFDSNATNIKPGFIDPNWSEDVFVFAREAGPPDQDGDGAPDTEEQGPDGNDPLYDGDGDGVPDYLQDIVVSGFTLDSRQAFRSRVVQGPSLVRVRPVALSEGAPLPAGVNLPLGGLDLQAFGAGAPGAPWVVEFEFPEGPPFNSYYKWGRRPGAAASDWYEFMYDGETGAELDGHRVRLHLVDGARGDDDGSANGELQVRGGPAQVGTAAAPQLEVGPTQVILADPQQRTSITLRNTGGLPLVWAIPEGLPDWLRTAPRRGELEPAQAIRLTLEGERAGLSPGRRNHALEVRSGGGTRTVEVTLEVPFALAASAEWVGSCLVLHWRSQPGAVYRVQYTDSLSHPDWRPASELILAPDTASSWTDCRAAGAGRFYRVRLDP